jgi:undecaprenyl diphosphate synthase
MAGKKIELKHLAIIMDGNGRWAKKRGLPRIFGHRAGIKAVGRAIEVSLELQIKYLTFYAFSMDNWSRPKKEVSALMNLLKIYLKKELKKFNENGIRLRAIGRLEKLPKSVRSILSKAMNETKDNKRLILTLALSYGGRDEIVEAAKRIAVDLKRNKIKLNQINERLFSDYLYTSEIPDPDLLIRTSYELRLSNFMLWQLSYTEFYFSRRLWPDFTKQDLKIIVKEYKKRERRFGKV